MKKLLTVAALIVTALPLRAQSSKPAPQDTAAAKFVGAWEGKYFGEQGENRITLKITRDSVVKGTVDIVAPHEVPTLQMKNIVVKGNAMSWVVDIMDGACTATSTFLGGDIKGEMKCPFGTLGFLVKKQ